MINTIEYRGVYKTTLFVSYSTTGDKQCRLGIVQGKVYHYDSLQAKCIAPELRKQLIALYGHTSDGTTLQIIQPQVQVQRGSKDCGCFAVAFAVSLLLGDDPTTLTYHQKDMREHFIVCLEARLFTPFPATEKKAKRRTPDMKLNIQL